MVQMVHMVQMLRMVEILQMLHAVEMLQTLHMVVRCFRCCILFRTLFRTLFQMRLFIDFRDTLSDFARWFLSSFAPTPGGSPPRPFMLGVHKIQIE